jgi:hypothetical protein
MKYVTATVIAAVVACGVSYGQEMPSNYEHLKCYDQLIGTWVYEGPALESVPDIVEKGDAVILRQTFKWILEKNVVEATFYGEVKGGFKGSGKGLIGWDTAEQRIISGGMNSFGGHGLSTITYDADAKTWTTKSEGTDGSGEKTSGTSVLRLTGKDTIVIQDFDRKGGLFQGDSPKYTYKRVKRGRQRERNKQAE